MTSLAADGDEYLEDGTRVRTPSGDNLVLDYARLEADAFASIVESRGGRILDDPDAGLRMCDLAIATPFGNVALVTHPIVDSATPEVIRRLTNFYSQREGGPFLVFSPWRTTDWSTHGLHRVGHPPLMLRPAGGTGPTVEGLDIVTVDNEIALADFERTLIEAYPVPELQPWERGCYLHPDVLDSPWRCFVGYESGRPVATAASYLGPRLTIVELVSTRPECRGRGYGAAVTCAASMANPGVPSMLIASDDGLGVYESLGYLRLLRYTMWLGTRTSG